MLTLTLRRKQAVHIGDDIKVVVRSGRRVKLSIQAPTNVSIDRDVIYWRKQAERTSGAPCLRRKLGSALRGLRGCWRAVFRRTAG